MDRHAGFAASVAVRQALLQDLVGALYHGGQIPHRFSGSMGGTEADLFLDKPIVTCAASNGGRLLLDLQAWGPLTIAPPGQPPSSRTVLLRMQVLSPPRLALDGPSLTFRLDGPMSTLQALDVDALVGGPYPPAAQAVIDSPAFFAGIQLIAQSVLGSLQRVAPPLDLSFLGPVIEAPGAAVTARVRDGALAFGIDVADPSTVTTHGNAGLLIDTTAGNDIGMWTNPAVLPLTMSAVRATVAERVTAQSATLDSLTFGIGDTGFTIAGSATKGNEGSVSFSLRVVPHLYRPSVCEEWDEEYGEHFVMCTPERHELWFEITDVEVDIIRPWWVILLDILGAQFTFAIGTLVVESIVGMIRTNITSGIENADPGSSADRVRAFTFAGTPEPTFRLKIEQFECHAEGQYTGLTLRPQIPLPKITGPTAVSAEEAMSTTLRFQVLLPFDSQADDPQLSVRWTVRRTDTNAVLITRDLPAASNRTIDLSGQPELLQAPSFDIACRVYRTMGPVTTDLFNGTARLTISDRLDRSHPYVRWDHTCYAPIVVVEPDGSRTEQGFDLKHRHSRIHRTAIPGRCKMVSRYSSTVAPVVTDPLLPHLTYLDALPFPVADLAAHRPMVCDYCFFGGPTRTVPLI